MLIGLKAENNKLIFDDVKYIPDFWHQDYYQYIFHNDWFALPSWKEKTKIANIIDNYQPILTQFLKNAKNKNFIVFNEIFRSDAGVFSTALRQGLTVEKIKEILIFVKENSSSESRISLTEHRMGSLFLVRQQWFLNILKECEEYIDEVGLQLWLQPSSPLYAFQKEVSFELIKQIQCAGFNVFISECSIFETDREKQADILDNLLDRLKKAGVSRFTYWYLNDYPELTQPYRDCSLGPGLFDADNNPKPAWEVIKKYAAQSI